MRLGGQAATHLPLSQMGSKTEIPLPKTKAIALWHSDGEDVGPTFHHPSCHILSVCSDLSWNVIRSIHPEAFSTLHSLVKL